MATATLNYAAAGTLTWGMTSASSDSTLLQGRESTSVDNETTNKYLDAIIGGHFVTHASTAAVGRIEVWAYGSWDGGTTFTADCTGTDGALTLVSEIKRLLVPVTTIITNATNSEVYKWGPVALAPLFGGILPSDWGLWGVHNSGGALATSTTKWQGIKVDIA